MSDPEFAVVFETPSSIEADVVRALLETHGIHAMVSSAAPQAVFPVTLSGLGEVRLSVHQEAAASASRLIGEFRQEVSERLIRIRDEFRVVEEMLGYRFTDPGLLEHALTHRSKAHEDVSGDGPVTAVYSGAPMPISDANTKAGWVMVVDLDPDDGVSWRRENVDPRR